MSKPAVLLLLSAGLYAQTSPPMLTLQQAEAMALQNHPQVQAAQHEASYAGEQVTISRSAYYPQVTGDVTGSQGNTNARIGAGDLSASRLFDRFGQGIVANQLITDSGRHVQSGREFASSGPGQPAGSSGLEV